VRETVRTALPHGQEPVVDLYRDADRVLHAAAAALTAGISPISLLQAWQDWALHLAVSPGKQQELIAKGFEKSVRLADYTDVQVIGLVV
jgi:polyhydroxyalkanoate synthase